jgi:hypothetical protein
MSSSEHAETVAKLWRIAAGLHVKSIGIARGKEWTATQVMRVLGQEKAPLGSL